MSDRTFFAFKLIAIAFIVPNFSTANLLVSPPPLIAAVHNNNISQFQKLLRRGEDPNWISTDSSTSVLSESILSRNPTFIQNLLPYLKNVNQPIKGSCSPIHVFASLSADSNIILAGTSCTLLRKRTDFTNNDLVILEALLKAGADFNKKNQSGLTPLDILASFGNPIWIKIATLFINNTYIQNSLQNFALRYTLAKQPDLDKLFQNLIAKISNIGPVLDFYINKIYYSRANGNHEIQDYRSIVKELLQYATKLPDDCRELFGQELINFAINNDLEMVNWILKEVPKKYSALNHGLSIDSIATVLANYRFTNDTFFDSILRSLLTIGDPKNPKSNYAKIVYELLLYNFDPFVPSRRDNKTDLDFIIDNQDLVKAYFQPLELALLREQMLDFNQDNTTISDNLGLSVRKDIYDFRNEEKWLSNLQFCYQLSLANVSPSTGPVSINITNIGQRSLGTWPMSGCQPFSYSVRYDATKPSSNQLSDYILFFSIFNKYKDDTSLIFYKRDVAQWYHSQCQDLYNSGMLNISPATLMLHLPITIPKCQFSSTMHNSLPMVRIVDPLGEFQISQNNNTFHLSGPAYDTLLDRSLGEITMKIDGRYGMIGGKTSIYGNITYTNYNNLKVPSANDDTARSTLYLELIRQKLAGEKSGISNPEKKNIIACIHILSEYAIQYGYIQRVKDEYNEVNRLLNSIESTLIALNQFYRSYGTLTWENLPSLEQQIQQIINSPKTGKEEKIRFVAYFKELKDAKTQADLSTAYFDLFNDKLNSLIDDYVEKYQILTLELAQYSNGTLVSDDSNLQILLKQPIKFRTESLKAEKK